jgi:hypothetical protein
MMDIIRPLVGSWMLRRAIDNGASMIGTASLADFGGGRVV